MLLKNHRLGGPMRLNTDSGGQGGGRELRHGRLLGRVRRALGKGRRERGPVPMEHAFERFANVLQ
ncbi:MAG: hypothetical protein RL499_6, partial [Actinomycetota bacterium]